jgi:hypothetical protein
MLHDKLQMYLTLITTFVLFAPVRFVLGFLQWLISSIQTSLQQLSRLYPWRAIKQNWHRPWVVVSSTSPIGLIGMGAVVRITFWLLSVQLVLVVIGYGLIYIRFAKRNKNRHPTTRQ